MLTVWYDIILEYNILFDDTSIQKLIIYYYLWVNTIIVNNWGYILSSIKMEKYFHTIRYLSFCQLTLGVFSMICGILQLVYAWDGRDWPINSGVGIWAGVVVGILYIVCYGWSVLCAIVGQPNYGKIHNTLNRFNYVIHKKYCVV